MRVTPFDVLCVVVDVLCCDAALCVSLCLTPPALGWRSIRRGVDLRWLQAGHACVCVAPASADPHEEASQSRVHTAHQPGRRTPRFRSRGCGVEEGVACRQQMASRGTARGVHRKRSFALRACVTVTVVVVQLKKTGIERGDATITELRRLVAEAAFVNVDLGKDLETVRQAVKVRIRISIAFGPCRACTMPMDLLLWWFHALFNSLFAGVLLVPAACERWQDAAVCCVQ